MIANIFLVHIQLIPLKKYFLDLHLYRRGFLVCVGIGAMGWE